MSVPTRSEYFDRWSALHGGVRPDASPMVKGWLTLIYICARPLAALRIHPDVLTLVGGLVAALVVILVHLGTVHLGPALVIVAAVVTAISGVFDSLDGAVAVLTDRTSRWGALLDSLVDRVSDVLYLLALSIAGAPGWLCVFAGTAIFLLEYARARALAIGMDDVGIISIGERPTRVAVVAMFLLAAGVYPDVSNLWSTAGAGVLLLICTVGLAQFLWVARRRLH